MKEFQVLKQNKTMQLHCRAFCSALFSSLVFTLCRLKVLFLGTTLDAYGSLYASGRQPRSPWCVCSGLEHCCLQGPSDIGRHLCQLKAAPQFTPINLKLDTAGRSVVEALGWGWQGFGFVGTTNWERADCHCLSLMRKHVRNIRGYVPVYQ